MIQIKNLTKTYQNKTIYQNLNINLPSKGLVGITGKSGTGKTTLLNLIGLLDQPTDGDIFIHGLEVTKFTESEKSHFRRNHIGFIFQDHQLIPTLNVYENIKMGLTFAGIELENFDIEIRKIATDLNISHLLFDKTQNLSGGEKQRVSIARSLIKNPSIILADEPTGSLDFEQANEVISILKAISKERLVLIVSHDKEMLEVYSDYIFKLDHKEFKSNSTIQTDNQDDLTLKKTKLKNKVLFTYAFKNLSIHKIRTLMLTIILVVSIVGIALSFQFNQALNDYIDQNEQRLVDVFPIEIDTISLTMKSIEPADDFPKYPNFSYILPANIQNEYVHLNTLDDNFYQHMKGLDLNLVEQLSFIYDINLNFVRNLNNSYSFLNLDIDPMVKSENQLSKEFDVLYQNPNQNTDYQLALILDNYNRVPYNIVNRLGLPTNQAVSFETLGNIVLYYIPNNDLYEEINPNQFSQKDLNTLNPSLYRTISISKIIRQKTDYEYFSLNPGLYMNYSDYETLYLENESSDIVTKQLAMDSNILTGLPFQENQPKSNALKSLGYALYPNSYRISAKDHTSKLAILSYIKSYSLNTIIPLDKAELGLSFARNAFNFFNVLGYGFIIVSLLTSISMIGLTTYTSIIERANEIGILKTLGADQKDITKSFGYELFIVGFISIISSMVIVLIVIPLINLYLVNLLGVNDVLKVNYLLLISFLLLSLVFITLIGLIPVFIHNRKQAIDSIKFKL